MSKKRKGKNRGNWESFINRIFNHPRADRQYKLPSDYIMSIADKIHKTNPSREILYNTLVEFASVIGEKFYMRRLEDEKWLKEKKEARLRKGFNAFKDWLQDHIPSNNQNKK